MLLEAYRLQKEIPVYEEKHERLDSDEPIITDAKLIGRFGPPTQTAKRRPRR